MCDPFETVEEALLWAVRLSHHRFNSLVSIERSSGRQRPCEIVDVFNVFKKAYRIKLIDKNQYVLFLYAKKYGDLPPETCLFSSWQNMMRSIEPLMIEKGIIRS